MWSFAGPQHNAFKKLKRGGYTIAARLDLHNHMSGLTPYETKSGSQGELLIVRHRRHPWRPYDWMRFAFDLHRAGARDLSERVSPRTTRFFILLIVSFVYEPGHILCFSRCFFLFFLKF